MNLPRRRTATIVRPSSFEASARRLPGVTRFEWNSACTIRRPAKCGASERTTVSTSGSSGTYGTLWRLGNIDQNIVAFGFDWEHRERHVLIEIVDAGEAI